MQYPELYPGISLRVAFDGNSLKTEYIVEPGADPRQLVMAYVGAKQITVQLGDLVVEAEDGSVYEQPEAVAYQDTESRRKPIKAAYRVSTDGTVAFGLAAYDTSLPLIIDPYVVSSITFLGGSGIDKVNALDADSAGNLYIAGSTDSANFTPLPPALSSDGFVIKLNTANQVVWATYLQGTYFDVATALRVDALGNVYVAGYTTSSDFPTLATTRNSNAGGRDAFLAKLGPDGSLQFSGYLGGSDADTANGIGVNAANGEVWVAGETASADSPSSGPIRPPRAVVRMPS